MRRQVERQIDSPVLARASEGEARSASDSGQLVNLTHGQILVVSGFGQTAYRAEITSADIGHRRAVEGVKPASEELAGAPEDAGSAAPRALEGARGTGFAMRRGVGFMSALNLDGVSHGPIPPDRNHSHYR